MSDALTGSVDHWVWVRWPTADELGAALGSGLPCVATPADPALLARAEAAEDRAAAEYKLLRLSLDMNRLGSGDIRALHPENQWMLDIRAERDRLAAELAALQAAARPFAAWLAAKEKQWVAGFADAEPVDVEFTGAAMEAARCSPTFGDLRALARLVPEAKP
jgi:hypothetical protein